MNAYGVWCSGLIVLDDGSMIREGPYTSPWWYESESAATSTSTEALSRFVLDLNAAAIRCTIERLIFAAPINNYRGGSRKSS
jgi:hypothetical protein